MDNAVFYLAYGSNLHPGRLQARLGEVEVAGTYCLAGWRLVFNKRGEDDSAKANILHTGDAGDEVWCVRYRLPVSAMSELDHFETRGHGYDRVEFRLPLSDTPVSVQSYISPPVWQVDDWLPYDWYLELIRLGARYHDFPENYRQALADRASWPDPDAERARDRKRLTTTLAGLIP